MLKVADRILSPAVFKYLMLLIVFPMSVTFIHTLYGGYIKYILFFGIMVCIWLAIKTDLLKGLPTNKLALILLAFIVFNFVSVLLNRHYGFAANTKKLLYFLVFVILLVLFDAKTPVSRIKKEMFVFSVMVVVCTFILSFFSLLTYLWGIDHWYYTDNFITGERDVINYIGFYNENLAGLYNPNTCGGIAAISFFTSSFLLHYCFSEKGGKILLRMVVTILSAINLLLQYTVLLLTSSRGAIYALVITLGIVVFVLVTKNCQKASSPVRTLSAVILSLVVVFCFLLCSSPTIKFLQNERDDYLKTHSEITFFEEDLAKIISKVSDNTSFKAFFQAHILNFGSTITESANLDFNTTGRIIIWKHGIEIFKKAPLFGVTKEGLTFELVKCGDIEDSTALQGGLHNIYLTVLCSSGIVGFILYISAIGLALWTFLRAVVKKGKIDSCLVFSFGITMFFLLNELVEQRTVYTVSLFTLVFWTYFGYMYYFSTERLKEDINET